MLPFINQQDSARLNDKLANTKKIIQDLEKQNNGYKLEANRFKGERDKLRLTLQDLQAQLFESEEEAKAEKETKRKVELLAKENSKIQSQCEFLSEKLRKAEDRVKTLISVKYESWNSFNMKVNHLECGVLSDYKKLKSNNQDLYRENCALISMNEELSESIKLKDQQLSDQQQLLDQTLESYSTRRKALEERILGLEKVNLSLQESLRKRNGSGSD